MLATRWNLDNLYTSFDSAEYKNDVKKLGETIAELTKFAREQLNSKENVKEKLEKGIFYMSEIDRYVQPFYYANLFASTDTTNETAMKEMDKLRGMFSEAAEPRVIFNKFIGGIDNLDEIINSSELLKEHSFILKEQKEMSKYTLSEKEEVVFAKMENSASSAWSNMRNQLASTLMVDIEMDGEMKSLPLSVVRNLAFDSNQETRKKAYYAELKAYEKIDKACAFAINSIKGEALTNVELRGYDSALDMTLKNSRLSKQSLDAMIGAMEDFLPSLRRYYSKKAELLGHKNGLPFYDVFAPVGKVDMRFTYDEAADFIVKNFSKFSSKLGNFADRVFKSEWIDADPRDGKTGGGFCLNVHSIKESRILVNFSNSFDNVSTIAHEIGHAYHGDCLNSVSSLNSEYPMPIAETASTFCETIIYSSAVAQATPDESLVILETELSNDLQIVVDIYSRYLFETELFKRRHDGFISSNELNEMMLDAQRKAYGNGLDHDFLHKYMWVNKTHYYSVSRNFYNFPYAFGLLFGMGLYSQFLEKGDSFVAKYDEILKASGSNSLEDVAKLADIDITKKEFWAKSLKVIESKVDEFCKM